MIPHYAIGDVHGRLDLLNDLLGQIKRHAAFHNHADYKLVFLGDLVDRGPDSKGVIDRVMELEKQGNTIVLKGNHEDLMINAAPRPFVDEKPTLTEWRDTQDRMYWWTVNGGYETMESYGGECARVDPYTAYRQISREHLDWLKALPTFYETDTHYFVHAGVNPNKPLDQQNDNARMWIRDEWLYSSKDMGKHIVHGHTPKKDPELNTNRTNLDTGAVFYGTLTCGVFTQPGTATEVLQSRGKSG